MSVAVRDATNQQNAQPNIPNLVVVGELSTPANGHLNRLGVQRDEVWMVPTHLLFYPQGVLVVNPPLPSICYRSRRLAAVSLGDTK